jgi:hypothetical protein
MSHKYLAVALPWQELSIVGNQPLSNLAVDTEAAGSVLALVVLKNCCFH